MTLIERVKKILDEKGMSFSEFASLMEAPRASLYKSIKAENVKYSTIIRMSEILKVDPCALVSDMNIQRSNELQRHTSILYFYISTLSESLVKVKLGLSTFSQLEHDFDYVISLIRKDDPNLLTREDLEILFKQYDRDIPKSK